MFDWLSNFFTPDVLALIGQGLLDTLYMTLVSTALSYVLGLPLGILLVVTDKDGIFPDADCKRHTRRNHQYFTFRSVFDFARCGDSIHARGGWHVDWVNSNDCAARNCSCTVYCAAGGVVHQRKSTRA